MGAYHLYRSSSLESFLERFPELFLDAHPLDDPVYIVVQNAGLGEWLIRRLARERGAVMGARVLMPEQAMRRFVEGYPSARALLKRGSKGAAEGAAGAGESGGERSLLYSDGLKLTLYKALEEAIDTPAGDGPDAPGDSSNGVFAAPARYVSGNPGRLRDLAGELAGIFQFYGANCRGLVESWELGPDAEDGGAGDTGSAGAGVRAAEAWQRRLWRRVFHPDAPYSHLSLVLRTVMESRDRCDIPAARIVLFGSMFLGERGLGFFRRLAEDLDVHHFVLSPTANRGELRTMFLRGNAALPAGFEAAAGGLNPASEDDDRPNPGKDGSALHRLRESFIHDRPFEGKADNDGSLALHDVSGAGRTIEVLKDRILEALGDDPDLAPTEIGVLAPDIAVYAPYLEIVFPSLDALGEPRRDHLPFNLSDIPSGGRGAFSAALGALTELPGSRFGRPALAALIENPCFAPAAGREELAAGWKRLIDEMNVRWGMDEDHRRSMGAGDLRSGSWEFAFERILAGYCFDEGDIGDILPRGDAGDPAAEDAGALMQVIRDLDAQVRRLDERVMDLREWTRCWERITERFLAPRDEDEGDLRALKNAFRDIIALCDDVDDLSDFPERGLPWAVFRDMLNEFRGKSSGRRGRYLARGVTCASLKPTRAIPFRRIYVLGLDEGVWPGRDNLTGFDLRGEYAGVMNLSREAVDRLALLEVFFSASEHLSLFYTGRDPKNGDPLAPAAPVQELLDHLGGGSEKLIRRYPLMPGPRALEGGGPLSAGSPEEKAAAPRREPLPGGDEAVSVNRRRLVQFLRNPVRHFFRYSVGADIADTDDSGDEGDVLDADSYRWRMHRRELLSGDIAVFRRPEAFARKFEERLRGEGAFARSPAEGFQRRRLWADAELLAGQLEGFEDQGLPRGPAFSCRFTDEGGGPEGGIDPSVFENGGCMNLGAPRVSLAHYSFEGAPMRVSIGIEGRVEGLRRLNGDVWTMVEFVDTKRPGLQHCMESWTAALMIGAALGEEAPREIRVFRVGGATGLRRYCFQRDAGGEGGGGPGKGIMLENPGEILGRPVKAYREGEREPLWLYPEIADELAGTPGDVEPREFSGKARRAWERVLGDRYRKFSTLRGCLWRSRFLGEPDFASPGVFRFWRDVYARGGLG